ncbi:hypothetical protein M2451_003541 [Dysgonomonas sp. PFB1-18]|uniref:hypothetical protein n=1 Tax=unclassified Dysgonomonas TaxID=2630389 RepID=UPI002476CAA4|nr:MULTISPECIES: hypothetical protein [unclassified Dysgonomonas]MDH6310692.1 hypothetical protein [Dysgonomonas sp. PF1-14]MDH6340543.1 hypothetical protein [Dysgonomonas sp. PF1-16]MDH6382201.1 hypothetical protein [Dysgonomonas sp. PFB1-18]MDH6399544.1 hypothetical protein [Dysgonomonas sp. PF1-23]
MTVWSYIRNALVFLSVFFFACGAKDDGARLRLDTARHLYEQKKYIEAKEELDSIKILYPKSFDEIRAGLALLDTIRRAENVQIITECDSLITLYNPQLEKAKRQFIYQRNKDYQESGAYVPKETISGEAITATTLRSGVGDDGVLYIESVFVGVQKHNKIRVAARDGSFMESLPVNDDGLNYRFSNMDKSYEIIRFAGANENGIGGFIYSHEDKPLTVTLEGQGKYSYILSQTIKSAVSKSFHLSNMMLQLDSLKTAKEKAEYHIYYLDNKKNKEAGDNIK